MVRIGNTLIGWLVVIAAIVAFVSTLTTMAVSSGNRQLQREIAQRQQEVNQAIHLGTLNTQIVQTLATLSVQRNDPQLAKLLGDHGITIQVNQPAPSPNTPATPPATTAPGATPSVTR